MSESSALTAPEEVLVGEVIEKGASVVNSENIDELLSAMLKISSDTFASLKTIVINNSKLQKEIAERISETVQQAMESNDKVAQEVLDTLKANSETIRSIIPNSSGQDLIVCLEELRENVKRMDAIRRETQASNDRNVQRQKETAEHASQKSSNIILDVLGSGALGLVLFCLCRKLKKLQ